MVSSITLTASMRSNLTSLRTIASQMSQTQERLSSGKKVNSAIDNASSYYQARSLTNRAADLNALLDSMGQGIQTIQAATTGLEKVGEFLEHAAVIAQEAYEAALIPEKAYFEAKVGENGAVVTSAQELKDAVNAGKGIICVYGKIDYFENETLGLKAYQKLVGTEYFTGYTGNKKFSEINFKGTQDDAIKTASNNLLSDLSLTFESINRPETAVVSKLIYVAGRNNAISNLDINHYGRTRYYPLQGTITVNSGDLSVRGNINVNATSAGCFAMWNGKLDIAEDAIFNCNISDSHWGLGIIYENSQLNIHGKINLRCESGTYNTFIVGNSSYSGNNINIYDSAEITLNHSSFSIGSQKDDNICNTLNIEAGAKVNLKDDEGTATLISQDYTYENKTTSNKYVTSQTLRNSGDFTEVSSDIDWDNFATPVIGDPEDKEILNKIVGQYNKMLTAMDELIADTSYQGINLLNGGDMTVTFNEDRTHSYTVNGSDMSSTGLGITTREWVTKQDVLDSINEIKAAMNSIRDEVARLGNSYSIIQTREKFTEAMTDVLETGADNLVLADMNEESADYLSLQVRNNLAINALALASQSAQSVLKLF